MTPIKIVLRTSAAAIMFFATACSILKQVGTAPLETPAAASPPPAETGLAQATEPPSCPLPDADQSAYDGSGPGFCFVYPSDFYLFPSTAVTLIGPTHGSGVESQTGNMSITSDNLAGQSLQEYADQVVAQNGEGGSPARQAVSLTNGYPALLIDGLRSQLNWRDLLIEHKGRVYLLSFQPWDGTAPAAREDLQRLYASVIDSWVFLN
jgi:hypothetical protein